MWKFMTPDDLDNWSLDVKIALSVTPTLKRLFLGYFRNPYKQIQ